MRLSNFRPPAAVAALLALLATAGWAQTPPGTPRRKPARPSKAEAGSPPATKPHPIAQKLCAALHTLPAKRRTECCGTTPSSLAAVCAQELSASLSRGAVSLDDKEIDQCAAETAKQLEGCDWVTPLMPRLPESCRRLVHGRLKVGAPCRSSLECADGLFCKGVSPTREGVCAAPGAARTRCEVPPDNLAAFTGVKDDPRHPVCEGLCIKGQCLPYTPAGGACASSARCAPGLNCISGRCQDRPFPKLGDSCASNTSCEGAVCQAGRCVALKGEGEPCTLPVECRAFACLKAPGAGTGTCGPPCGPSSQAPAQRDATAR